MFILFIDKTYKPHYLGNTLDLVLINSDSDMGYLFTFTFSPVTRKSYGESVLSALTTHFIQPLRS